MAEENEDGSSKTEEASPRKLEEARRQGDVAKSPDVASWASLAAVIGVVVALGQQMCVHLADNLMPFVAHPDAFDLQDGGAVMVLRLALMAALPILAAVMGAAMIAGAAGNLAQHGFLFTPSKLAPDLSRLSLLKGFERMFGIDGLVQFGKSVVKIALVAVATWISVRGQVHAFQALPQLEPLAMLAFVFELLRPLVFSVLLVLGVTALVDWFWQRQRFQQRMRMTKQEQKEDARQTDGDPHVKARLRQIRMARARRRMMQNVPKATVVVMNPTHYAVALRYEAGDTPAPLCVAKGIDSLALKIREVAQAHGVTVIEDPPLARALYAAVEIDEAIPREHYEAVAKIIGFVLQGARRRRAR
jgi:flagellar biosynthetic protein FlhB